MLGKLDKLIVFIILINCFFLFMNKNIYIFAYTLVC